jgi:hypothetical protein
LIAKEALHSLKTPCTTREQNTSTFNTIMSTQWWMISFQYCSMFNMGANALTKKFLAPKHSKCMQILGLMKLDQVEM